VATFGFFYKTYPYVKLPGMHFSSLQILLMGPLVTISDRLTFVNHRHPALLWTHRSIQ